jgi:hypothetical protein
MVLYEMLSPEEVEILREKYDILRKKLNKSIIDSGLFQKGYLLNRLYIPKEYDDWFFSKSYYETKSIENEFIKIKNHCISIETNDKMFELNKGWNPIIIKVLRKENIRIRRSFFSSVEEYDLKEEIFTPFYIKNEKYKFREDQNLKYYKTNLENIVLVSDTEKIFLNKIINIINEFILEVKNEIKTNKNNLVKTQESLIVELDKNNDGIIDLVDCETLSNLLRKEQNKIIEFDKNYIQKFVKISMYLNTKKDNIQTIFNNITITKNQSELSELIKLLKNQVYSYDLLVFHSLNLISSLIDDDLITFYEIYECFDKLGVFNSNWENEVSNKLTNIGDGIKDLMYSIQKMEYSIVSSINNLTYVNQESFKTLSKSVEKHLSSINSSINFNNLLTGIQTYQMYRINHK